MKALFPSREGTLFPPLDKRNTRDKAKGLRITSERYIGELGVRCLSTINKGRILGDSLYIYYCVRQSIGRPLVGGKTAQLKFGEQ